MKTILAAAMGLVCLAVVSAPIQQNLTTTNPPSTLTSAIFTMFAAGSNISLSIDQNGKILISTTSTPASLAPVINTFTNNASVVENGQTINSTTLGWVLSGGAPATQSIDNGIGSLSTALRQFTFLSALTATTTFNLTVGNSAGNVSAATTVTFDNRRYWGVTTNAAVTDAELRAGSSELAADRFMTKTLSPANQYMYFAFPTNFGTPTFIFVPLGSPDIQFFPPSTRVFTNASGYATTYNIYTGSFINSGSFPYQVQ